MSKPCSCIPMREKRARVVPRWLKEAFVAFAAVAVLAVGISKAVQHFGGIAERVRSSLGADELDGRAAPAIKLPSRGGGQVDLAALRGKVVLVNFWATWCPPCLEEMPSLERLWRRHKDAGFVLVAISLDADSKKVPPFVSARKFSFPIALDPKMAVAEKYGVRALP